MSDDLRKFRTSRTELEQELRAWGSTNRGADWRCIAHGDKHASGRIGVSDDGIWRFKCFKPDCGFCGDVFDVRAARTGKKLEDILREAAGRNGNGNAEKSKPIYKTIDALKGSTAGCKRAFVYTNPDTMAAELVVLRCEDGDKKWFPQWHPVQGGFAVGACQKPLPIYNRTRVRAAKTVVCCEGEKCVHAFADMNIVATTNPRGAGTGGVRDTDWRPLAGKKIILWPDNDEVGAAHMREVADTLAKLDPPCDLRIVDVGALDLPPKGDVVEFLEVWGLGEADGGRGVLLSALDRAIPVGSWNELEQRIEDMIAGKFSALAWPFKQLTRLTRALIPGTVTLIIGEPGARKSFLMMQCLAFWLGLNITVAVYELEDTMADHLNRALAQIGENGNLTNAEWVNANPDLARAAAATHKAMIERMGRAITTSPDEGIRIDVLAEWVEKQCQDGKRIVVVDPVTIAEQSKESWVDDKKFLIRVKTAARRYGASVVLLTHPRGGKHTFSLDDLAGGRSYPRFSHAVIWVVRLEKPKPFKIVSDVGIFTSEINATFKLCKTRHGPGAGMELGFIFDGQSLKFGEQGVIVGPDKEA